MGKRHEMTVSEMAALGGKARARLYTAAQLRALGIGRPAKLTPAEERRILALVRRGWKHTRAAREFGISTRTLGRIIAKYHRRREV